MTKISMNPNNLNEDALKLDAVFKTASDGIILINEFGLMEMVNEAASVIFGYNIEELINQNVAIIMNNHDSQLHNQYLDNYSKTGEKKIIGIGREVIGKKKDGSLFPIRLSVSEVLLKNKKIYAGILHDLTREKKAEQALQEEKEKAQSYLDIAHAIILVLDPKGNIVLVNQRGCQILGYQESEMKGKNWFTDFNFTIPASFKNFISDYSSDAEIESEMMTKNGVKKIISWRTAPMTGAKGTIIAHLFSGMDITLRKEAENKIKSLNLDLENRVESRTEELADAVNQLLNINKQLQFEIKERKNIEQVLRENENHLRSAFEKERELNELKSRFVSMASHEFRTPLSTISSSADLIEAYIKEEEQDKRLKHTQRIKSSVANLTGILNDFLSLSKLEEGKTSINPKEINLDELLNEIHEELFSLLKPGQKILFNHSFQSTFISDRNVLKNIMLNLFSNAIKYSPNNTEIQFTGFIHSKKLVFRIKDQGIGIPDEDKDHLFTRFFRAHNAENVQGTGLGLNIVKRYLDLLRGNITFNSTINQGTEFEVEVPELMPEQ
jgi:PAS domain S-box-containing protein